jgi:FAD/FMN-containing dehydrogenase
VAHPPVVSKSGRTIPESALSNFVRNLSGRLVRADDPDYDTARQIWPRAIDRHPALVAQCKCAADVGAAINFAQENELLVAVRGGGHTSFATCNGGLVIDLGRMKGAGMTPDGRYVQAETGLTSGELDEFTNQRGMAAPLGECPSTGIGGLTLGGGLGYLLGSRGLACDNLVRAEVIDARGRTLIASEDDDANLFWALRGGGGNFGVVTSLTFRLHPLREVLGGTLTYPTSQIAPVLRRIGEFAEEAPDELALIAMDDARFTPVHTLSLMVCWSGRFDEGEKVLRRIRDFGPAQSDSIKARPWLEMQRVMDIGPVGVRFANDVDFISAIDARTADALAANIVSATPGSCGIALELFHGAACRVSVAGTAFSVRRPGFFVHMTGAPDDGESLEPTSAALARFREALQPVSTGDTYLNGLGLHIELSEARVKRGYGPNYPRLRRLKSRYDPANFFRLNPNIRPAKSARGGRRS